MKTPSVAILLGTRDGAEYLRTQLASFTDQSNPNWALYASDDGSSDDTVRILEDFKRNATQHVSLRQGPLSGFSANFMSLAQDRTIGADFFAFSDQDDIWLNDKLERATSRLAAIEPEIPTAYFSRTELIDDKAGACLGHSLLFTKAPSFRNALVQSIGGANTAVFNRAAKALLEETSLPVVAHDWWLYQIVTGAGGVVIYDPVPSVKYRQHGSNLLGTNLGFRAVRDRLALIADGTFHTWNDINIRALRSMSHRLSRENLDVLDAFDDARRPHGVEAIRNLRKSGVYRQTWLGNLALFVVAAAGRI